MIRRLPVFCAALGIAVVSMTGCSTVTKNSTAATVNDHELTVEQFETAVNELKGVLDPTLFTSTSVRGDIARNLLSSWVIGQAMFDRLELEGKSPSAEVIKQVEDGVAQSAGEDWAGLSQATKDTILPAFVIGEMASTDPTIDTTDLGGATVTIDSRYGMWDADNAVVVASR